MFGRRRSLLLGLSAFGAVSLGVLFIDAAWQLAAIRALLGMAAAFMAPATMSLTFRLFDDDKLLGKAIGLIVTVAMIGFAIGPVLSGLAVEHMSWHVLLLLNAPVALIAVLGVAWGIPADEKSELRTGSLDTVGPSSPSRRSPSASTPSPAASRTAGPRRRRSPASPSPSPQASASTFVSAAPPTRWSTSTCSLAPPSAAAPSSRPPSCSPWSARCTAPRSSSSSPGVGARSRPVSPTCRSSSRCSPRRPWPTSSSRRSVSARRRSSAARWPCSASSS
ncbi:MFS transporter [Dermacoccus abyssi]|uniref:MFS transporter n=1 Tax=Dermacoccus abyssi TaxID=322596 RepID=A0ABX5Z6V8_9MICO|nr:MFS transporter [Dermacoccus abyssi]